MTPEQIAAAVAAGVRVALEEMALRAPPLPRLMYTAAEAAVITALPVSFFEREAPAGHIPSRKGGPLGDGPNSYRRYAWDDLVRLCEAAEAVPTSGPMAEELRRRRQAAAAQALPARQGASPRAA